MQARRSPAPPRKIRRSYVIIIVCTLAVFGFYWALFSGPFFSIETIQFEGETNDSLTSLTNRLLKTNIFRLNPTSLEAGMKQAYPPLASVSVVRGLPHTLRVRLELRQPTLRWQSGEVVSILDAKGESFQEGDKPEYASLPKVTDKSHVAIHIGQHVVSPEFIAFVTDLQKQVPSTLKKNITAVEISETSFHIDVVAEGDIRLRFTTQRPLAEQLKAVAMIYQAHPDAKLIDVRVPRWGYWKS